jgi:hypothetical protein
LVIADAGLFDRASDSLLGLWRLRPKTLGATFRAALEVLLNLGTQFLQMQSEIPQGGRRNSGVFLYQAIQEVLDPQIFALKGHSVLTGHEHGQLPPTRE